MYCFAGQCFIVRKIGAIHSSSGGFNDDVRALSHNPFEIGILILTSTSVFHFNPRINHVSWMASAFGPMNLTDIAYCRMEETDLVFVVDYNQHVMYKLSSGNQFMLNVYMGELGVGEVIDGALANIRLKKPYSVTCYDNTVTVTVVTGTTSVPKVLVLDYHTSTGNLKPGTGKGSGVFHQLAEQALSYSVGGGCSIEAVIPGSGVMAEVKTCDYSHAAFIADDIIIINKNGSLSRAIYNNSTGNFHVYPEAIFIYPAFPWTDFHPIIVRNVQSLDEAFLYDPNSREIVKVSNERRDANRPDSMTGKLSFVLNKGFRCSPLGQMVRLRTHSAELCSYKCIKYAGCQAFNFNHQLFNCELCLGPCIQPVEPQANTDCYVWPSPVIRNGIATLED